MLEPSLSDGIIFVGLPALFMGIKGVIDGRSLLEVPHHPMTWFACFAFAIYSVMMAFAAYYNGAKLEFLFFGTLIIAVALLFFGLPISLAAYRLAFWLAAKWSHRDR